MPKKTEMVLKPLNQSYQTTNRDFLILILFSIDLKMYICKKKLSFWPNFVQIPFKQRNVSETIVFFIWIMKQKMFFFYHIIEISDELARPDSAQP